MSEKKFKVSDIILVLIPVGIFIFFEYIIMSRFIDYIILFNRGVFERSAIDDEDIFENICYYFIIMLFKTVILHIPSLISLIIMSFLAKKGPNFDMKIYKIMYILFIVSSVFMFFGSMYVELNI
ncbi:MAG: hypothetical protein LKJ13_02060 [Clostridia bacterium]|jgi:hypothetical protein|nr:hypothetical protein [Clostridia bacterium]MCI2000316.1 hypothetical protein [Clostridia bacterium]MCI2015496.1 hypothetical protein [Clostridia bacterium]